MTHGRRRDQRVYRRIWPARGDLSPQVYRSVIDRKDTTCETAPEPMQPLLQCRRLSSIPGAYEFDAAPYLAKRESAQVKLACLDVAVPAPYRGVPISTAPQR